MTKCIQYQIYSQNMLQVDKKKRNHSGSRSVSQISLRNHASTEAMSILSILETKYRNMSKQKSKLKIVQASIDPDQVVKTLPNKKNIRNAHHIQKIQQQRFQSKPLSMQEPISHSVSADRRHSIMKANRTQANFQEEEAAIDHLLMDLRSIPQPPCANVRLLNQYFNDLRRYFLGLEGPFHRLCLELHGFYVGPMQKFLQMVGPMEESIRRKEQIARQIDRQVSQNEGLYAQLQPIDIQIFKLKEKIQENRALIEQKRIQRESKSKERQKSPEQPEPHVHFQTQPEPDPEPRPEKQAVVEQHIGKGFKLNLDNIGKLGHMSYQEEFESKIDQFSESWRNQALREKRC